MAIQKINLGREPLGEGGDTYRSANTKINENFSNTEHAASRLVGTEDGQVATWQLGIIEGIEKDSKTNLLLKSGDTIPEDSAAIRLVGQEDGRVALYEHVPKITSELGYSDSLTVSQKLLTETVTPRINDIGVAGHLGFGVGIAGSLPEGMTEMLGTTIKGHENFGNYQYSDGSVMVYVPKFYYRWGHIDSPNFDKYGVNALDVVPANTFSSESTANSAGYALHRAFYDGGEIKQGFFVDKYQCSNNSGTASSIRSTTPLLPSKNFNPISRLDGSVEDIPAGMIDAAKTRGQDFFPTTIFIQKALALLSLAHAQASTSVVACAWYDASGVNTFPKGNNNNALRDANDTSVEYLEAGYLGIGKTGSGKPFAKTTHNGQTSGVADLNGNLSEVSLGITVDAGNFYVLKTSTEAKSLTSGNTLATDAWGTAGVVANYDLVGDSYGELAGASRQISIGSVTNPVFTNAKYGIDWAMDCAGVPTTGGVGISNAFGRDSLHDYKINAVCPTSGGYWDRGGSTGVWCVLFNASRSTPHHYIGFRTALYPV